MNKVLLMSGANGFVGTNLRKGFRINWDVLTLGRDKKSNDFNWETIEEVKKQPVDCFIHLAAKAHDVTNESNCQEYFRVNVGLTKNFFDVFLASNARTFIYFSSVKAVANAVDGELTEKKVPSPKTSYGKSKLEAERYLTHSQQKEKLKGKRLIILRPCMIHGPENKGNLNLLYNKVKKGIPYPFGCFSNSRSFLSVKNLSFAINTIIERDNFPGGVYNIADDQPLSSNQVVTIINKRLGRKPRIWNVPPFLLQGLAVIGDYINLPINTERLQKLTQDYIVSNSKIKKALNIQKFPLSSKEGLKLTIDSFQ